MINTENYNRINSMFNGMIEDIEYIDRKIINNSINTKIYYNKKINELIH